MIPSLVRILNRKKWAAFLLMLRVGGGILVQKTVAIKFGPYGTTALSHLQNFIGLYLQPIQDIVGQGILTSFSKESWSKSKVLSSAISFLLFIFSFVSVVIYAYQQSQIEKIDFLLTHIQSIIAAVFILSLQLLTTNLMISRGLIKPLVILTIFQWVSIFTAILYFSNSLDEQLLAYVITNALYTIIFLIYSYKLLAVKPSFRNTLSSEINKHFLQFLLIGISIWVSSKISAYAVRIYAISEYSAHLTGLWQAVVRISEAYKSLFISILMITMVPHIAKLESLKKIRDSFKNYLKPYAAGLIIFLIIAFILHEQILSIFYTPKYLEASGLMQIQLVADILALINIPFALLLISRVETKKYISAEIIGTFIYILAIVLLPVHQIEKILYAYFIRHLLYLVLILIFTKKYWYSA